ncbi:SOS response-associated peptidase [Maribacter sp. 2210JD10-5]|uniref:SOS response-associated peptidase n=1 Tax=Maribacter sp. 2210JD10-5 TaxID=3386272 RepID=UPI0039BCA731
MYYKISNTAEKDTIEKWANASFKYPNLYQPQQVINGLNEVSIPIITMENQTEIALAIWGLLPEKYKEDWDIFQNATNTLNFHEESMNSEMWYTKALENRRGIIPVTGFFTHYLKNGDSYPYYISLKNGKPFFLASIYNQLEDGFFTCSLLVGQANSFIKKFQNMIDCMPLTVAPEEKEEWLNSNTPISKIKETLKSPLENDFVATPIAKELFNNNISYDSMLLPYEYPKS